MSTVEKLLQGVFTPEREAQLWDLLSTPQDGDKQSPVEVLLTNTNHVLSADQRGKLFALGMRSFAAPVHTESA